MRTPQPGDYGVVSTNGIIARAIQFSTRSRQNHALIYVGNNQVIEARPGGVVVSPLKEYDEILWNFDDHLDPTLGQRIVDSAKTHIGEPYGYLNIFALLLLSAGIRVNWLLRKIEQNDHWICSQLVARAYKDCGFPLVDELNCEITPGDLAERLLEMAASD